MSRKLDRSRPPTPETWVTSRKCDRKIEKAEIATRERIVGERARTIPCYNPKSPAMRQPKQKRPLPQGWTEVNALSFRRSMRKVNRIMATELAKG